MLNLFSVAVSVIYCYISPCLLLFTASMNLNIYLFSVYEKEKEPVRKMSKMLVYSQDLAAGSTLKSTNFSLKSPNDGLSPQLIDKFIGKKLFKDVFANEIVALNHIVES